MNLLQVREAPKGVAGTITTQEIYEEQDQLQLVTFALDGEAFAIDILAVQEINRMMRITQVPQCPPGVEGVINLRGRIIAVTDLRQLFGMETQENSLDSRIMVVDVGGRTLGFIVDAVDEVLRINPDIVQPPPRMVASINRDYVRGVGKLNDQLFVLLDLEKLFDDSRLAAIDKVTEYCES